jgi:anaerobic magnesium-protoporphyrin IX monomethyl ester cyclase
MKTIILYNPKSDFYTMPLALMSIASNLDLQKFQIKIIDGRLFDDPFQEIKKYLYNALCFGVTVLTGPTIQDALLISRKVKGYKNDIPIVWGGWHPSLFPIDTLKENTIDFTVLGQGEISFNELVNAFDNKSKNFSTIPGICYKEKMEIKQSTSRNLYNMDDLPVVNYNLIDVENYFRFKKYRQFDYITSAGCFFRCSFCADPFVYKRKYSAYSSKRIGEEIDYYWSRYKFEELSFQDETFFTYKERILEMAEEFLKRGIKLKWRATMRADQGSRISEDEFKLLVKSGMDWLLIGVEAGSQKMLDKLRKDIKIEQIIHCAEMCKKFNVKVNFPSIVGFPDESEKDFINSLNFAFKLRLLSPLFETPIFYFKPYPGSDIVNSMMQNGYKLPETLDDWANFDFKMKENYLMSDSKYLFIENYKFYLKLSGGPETIFKKPLKILAKYRLKKNNFKILFDKKIIQFIKPELEYSF